MFKLRLISKRDKELYGKYYNYIEKREREIFDKDLFIRNTQKRINNLERKLIYDIFKNIKENYRSDFSWVIVESGTDEEYKTLSMSNADSDFVISINPNSNKFINVLVRGVFLETKEAKVEVISSVLNEEFLSYYYDIDRFYKETVAMKNKFKARKELIFINNQ